MLGEDESAGADRSGAAGERVRRTARRAAQGAAEGAAVETAFDLAAAARRRRRQKTALAVAYDAVTVPLALAGLLYPLIAMAGVAATGGGIAANATRADR
jgi:Cu2+-exporting ATPase